MPDPTQAEREEFFEGDLGDGLLAVTKMQMRAKVESIGGYAPCQHCGANALQSRDAFVYRTADDAGMWFCNDAEYRDWKATQGLDKPKQDERPGDPRFHAILDEIRALHERKGTDYGDSRTGDVFSNVRVAEQWGVPPWVGVAIRMTDKITRLQSYAITGNLANEGAEDSLMDLAAYAVIALILLREEADA